MNRDQIRALLIEAYSEGFDAGRGCDLDHETELDKYRDKLAYTFSRRAQLDAPVTP